MAARDALTVMIVGLLLYENAGPERHMRIVSLLGQIYDAEWAEMAAETLDIAASSCAIARYVAESGDAFLIRICACLSREWCESLGMAPADVAPLVERAEEVDLRRRMEHMRVSEKI